MNLKKTFEEKIKLKKTFEEKINIILINLFSLFFIGISITILLNMNKLIFLFTDFHSVGKTFIKNLPQNIDYNNLDGIWYGLYNNNYNSCYRVNIYRNNFNNILIFNYTDQSQKFYSKKYQIINNNSSILKNLNYNFKKELVKEDHSYIFFINKNIKNKYDFFATITPRDIFFTIGFDIQVYSKNPNINFDLQKNIVYQIQKILDKEKYIGQNYQLKKINYENPNCQNLIYNDFIDTDVNKFNLKKMFGDWFLILYGSSSYDKIRSLNNTCPFIKLNITQNSINKKCLNSLKTNSNGKYYNYKYEETTFQDIINIDYENSKNGKFLLNKNKNNNFKIILNNEMIHKYDNISRYQIINYYTSSSGKDNLYEYILLLISNNINKTVLFLSRMPIINKEVFYKYLYFLHNNNVIKDYVVNNNFIDYYN